MPKVVESEILDLSGRDGRWEGFLRPPKVVFHRELSLSASRRQRSDRFRPSSVRRVEPHIVAEVSYAEVAQGRLRAPVLRAVV